MEYQLLGISVLILFILLLTWFKDGEKMDPPLKKRIVIDLSTIVIFWVCLEWYIYCPDRVCDEEINWLLRIALGFFAFRLLQLIGQLNPLFKDLAEFIQRLKQLKNKETDHTEEK